MARIPAERELTAAKCVSFPVCINDHRGYHRAAVRIYIKNR